MRPYLDRAILLHIITTDIISCAQLLQMLCGFEQIVMRLKGQSNCRAQLQPSPARCVPDLPWRMQTTCKCICGFARNSCNQMWNAMRRRQRKNSEVTKGSAALKRTAARRRAAAHAGKCHSFAVSMQKNNRKRRLVRARKEEMRQKRCEESRRPAVVSQQI